MLRITTIHSNGHSVTLRLEGKITGQWASLLEGECRGLVRQHKAIQLDCASVDFIDAHGVEVVRSLSEVQVQVVNPPAFLTSLLDRGGRP